MFEISNRIIVRMSQTKRQYKKIRSEQRKYGFPKTTLADFIYALFRIPEDYDSMLRNFYGDYMTLISQPSFIRILCFAPVEERKDHHNLEIFWI